jgi:16S rRNA U1498 N3-methylase RsmE
MASTIALVLILLLASGCSTTRTVTDDVESGVSELRLKAGDKINVVTIKRERFRLEIVAIREQGMEAKTLRWDDSSAAPGKIIFIPYSDLAMIQIERLSRWKTAGAVATVTAVGAIVALIAVGPVIFPPPPP